MRGHEHMARTEATNTVLDSLGNLKRTHYCGDLRASDADRDVILMGWVHRRRDLGNLLFIDLRDRAGIAQIVFNKEQHPEAHARATTWCPAASTTASSTPCRNRRRSSSRF